MVKFLHTADLHLGRALESRPRWDEQRQVLDEIVAITRQEQVELVLLAGDIFDSALPPARAEEMFYAFVEQLSNQGRCAVVAIAGNHDQPQRLAAAAAIAAYRGVYLLGLPGQVLAAESPRPGVYLEREGRALHLRLASGESVTVAALPYVSEARLQEVFFSDLADDNAARQDYQQQLQACFRQLAAEFSPDSVNLVLAHLFISGAAGSDSERPLAVQVGGSLGLSRQVFPAGADYLALGHLHRPQRLAGDPPCFYAGSPLAYSFSEADQRKSVVIGQISRDGAGVKRADLRLRPLSGGRALTRHQAESYLDALDWCQDPANAERWVSLSIRLEQPLSAEQVDALHAAHPRLVAIDPLYAALQQQQQDYAARAEKSIIEQFADFAAQSQGVAADEALCQAFAQLLQQGEEDEA